MAERWKKNNPVWEYKLWNGEMMWQLLNEHHPHFIDRYNSYRYDVQRWDAIRYLILYSCGGLYVDLDYDCLEPIDPLLEGSSCCFGIEPPLHFQVFGKKHLVGNAFMACSPYQPFFDEIINELKGGHSATKDKFLHVLETTGPHMITRVYNNYSRKDEITLLPYEKVAPLNKVEVQQVMNGGMTYEIKNKIKDAYAVHYFLGTWLRDEK